MKDGNGKYVNPEKKNIIFYRLLWNFVSFFLFKPFPTVFFWKWNNFLLRLFGAQLSSTAKVYSSCQIDYPWNLKMGDYTCIGPHTIIENSVLVTLEDRATISQHTYLCTGSHNVQSKTFHSVRKPITLKKDSWVASNCFIGLGVTVGEGAVVGARASVFKDVEPWTIVGGNPAKFIKKRVIKD